MTLTTKSLLNKAIRFNDVVKDDRKVCLFILIIFVLIFILFRNLLKQKI